MHEVKTRLTDKDFLAKLSETKKALEGRVTTNPNKVEFMSSFLILLFIACILLMIIGLNIKNNLGLIMSALGLFIDFIIIFLYATAFKHYPANLRIIKFRQKYGLPVNLEGDKK